MNTDILLHIDYRSVLRERYQAIKASGMKYSFAIMAQELGLKDRAFVQHILAGSKELPASALQRTITWLNLNTSDAEYFTKLWQFATSRHADDKQAAWNWIRSHARAHRNETELAFQRTEIFDHWYSFVIKDLLCLGISEPRDIQKRLRVRIPLEDIHNCIERLIELEFISKNGIGCFKDLAPTISAPTRGEFATIVRNYQGELLDLAKHSLESTPPNDRETQTLALALSDEAFIKAQHILREARDKLLSLFESDQGSGNPPSRIQQCILALYPVADIRLTKNTNTQGIE